MTGRRPRFALALSFFLAAVGVVAYLTRFSPIRFKLPPCAFHALTGLYCPGCGSTRAIRRILGGDLVGAFRYNPLLVVLAPFLALQLAFWFYDLWRGRFPYRKGSLPLAYACVALAALFTVARNLPFDVCDWLRPPPGP